MKKHLFVFLVFLSPLLVFSQNVGIGNDIPLMKLHITNIDSSVLLLENAQALDIGVNTSMYFKTGNGGYPYTGGIKTIGTGLSIARLGFFTYAASSPNGLIERLSILDGGNVGIGLLSPSAKLEVEGEIKADSLDVQSGLIKNVADPINAQDAATKGYVDGEISSLPTITTYSVGDFAQGGIVFWVDETGQHGLVCAKSDQSSGIRWYAGTYGNTQAKGDGPYSGEANTAIIIAAQVAIGDDGSTYAARICNELQITEGGTTYGDWYLPSKYELDLMYDNKATIDATALANGGVGFAAGWYWSSTEYDFFSAWEQLFGDGNQDSYGKNYNFNVRAVRAF